MYHIHFIHEGKASYPEMRAYSKFFAPGYELNQSSLLEYLEHGDPSRTILWFIMGFYTKRPPALATIHDYRSLSTGHLAVAKDRIKALFNFRPDLRIYQNEGIRRALGFRDGVPEVFVGMGVPTNIKRFAEDSRSISPDFSFVYIGAISRERQIDHVIRSFLRHLPSTSTFLLVGPVEEKIRTQFRHHRNVIFTGTVGQEEAFRYVLRSRVAVSYFPYHRPHTFQTPTKLLEYAALGMPILANDSPMNVKTIRDYGILARVGTRDLFSDVLKSDEIQRNPLKESYPFEWPNMIQQSGISKRFEEILSMKRLINE